MTITLCGERLLIPVPITRERQEEFVALKPSISREEQTHLEQLVRKPGWLIPELELRTVRKFSSKVNIRPRKWRININIEPGAHFWARVV